MTSKKHFILALIAAALLSSCMRNQPLAPKRLLIHDNWGLSRKGSDTVYKAMVPGCVHLDLMANHVIPDPYFGLNENLVQWIEEEDWTYTTRFRVNSLVLDYHHVDLVFEGLDTYAKVYLNDSLILQADNMFRQWRIDVKDLLRKGFNDLKVDFRSPVKVNGEKASALPYPLPDERAFTRKAPYMFGWDWGPRLVTSGLWRPVYLETWHEVKIKEWKVLYDYIDSDSARARLELEVLSRDSVTLDCRFKVSVKEAETFPVALVPGTNKVVIPFDLEEPQLWWTHNLGEPFLYDFNVSFRRDGKILDRLREKFGLRTIELVHETDESGKSFYFKLNGVPVFMKGANYIPQDNFPSRVTDRNYSTLIDNVVNANMNMIRVWGGGIYEEDRFYELCDRQGVLVWQDFMYACMMYPGDEAFLDNARQEAIQQVTRLRNHPCIALWCGNNEVDEGWHNWEWQDQLGYSDEDSARIWNDYLALFNGVLPEVVESIDGRNPYWPSSPKHGWGRKESLTDGDMHYWGVWWGREPFEVYEQKVGRFMSEYGFQAYPPMQTIREAISDTGQYVGSPELLSHQKHPFGEEVIREFIGKSYPLPPSDSLEDYVYLSQLTQAYGIKTAIEAHRRARPYCMGTLYWQLNDCWPVISWSSLDYKGRRKALHYFAKRSFDNVLISMVQQKETFNVYLINDHLKNLAGKLSVALIDFSGNVMWSDTLETEATAGSSRMCYSRIGPLLPADSDPGSCFIRTAYSPEGEEEVYANYYLASPKDLELPAGEIRSSVSEEKRWAKISLEADILFKDVYLDFPGLEGWFTDNYFDLVPGERKTVMFYPSDPKHLPDLPDLSINHLNEIPE